MEQREVWEKIADRWQEFRKKQVPEAIDFLKDKKGKILDLGCGNGRNFVKGEIYAVDFSEKMLDFARQKAKKENLNVVFKNSDFTNLDFKDNFFDSAIFIRALHCVPQEKDREKALKELYRVLKKKGQALIQVWSKNHERLKIKKKGDFVPWTINAEKLERYYYIYEKKELENLLKKAGFKIIKSWEDKNISVVVEK